MMGNGLRGAVNNALTNVFVEQEFLRDRFSLRAQFDWKVARRGMDQAAEETVTGLSTIFRSPSERVFTREGVIEFLSQLRKMAAGHVRIRHASTPQVWVFRRGHHKWIEQDASIAPWRYLYCLGPRSTETFMLVAIETRQVMLEWFPWLKRTRIFKVIVGSNDLIIFPSLAVQSVLCQSNSAELKDQTIVLSGWLW